MMNHTYYFLSADSCLAALIVIVRKEKKKEKDKEKECTFVKKEASLVLKPIVYAL